MRKDLLRIVDANLNRSREGLRVCEEIVRFVIEDKGLTKEFKDIRHEITRLIEKFPGTEDTLLKCRDSGMDVGKELLGKTWRKDYKDVFFANVQRVKESIRVLEEFSNIFNRSLSRYFAKLRFKVYELEKKTSTRF